MPKMSAARCLAVLFALVLAALACTPTEKNERVRLGQKESAVLRSNGTGLGTPFLVGGLKDYLTNTSDGLIFLSPKKCEDTGGCPHASCTWPRNCDGALNAPSGWQASVLRLVVGTIAKRILANGYKSDWRFQDELVPDIFTGRYLDPMSGYADSIGYEIVLRYDQVMDRVLIILKPKTIPDPKGRNWGFFIFNEKPTSHHVIEIVHPRSDLDTEDVGVEAFEKSDTLALFIAGADRFAIDRPPGGDAAAHADVAHAHTAMDSTPAG